MRRRSAGRICGSSSKGFARTATAARHRTLITVIPAKAGAALQQREALVIHFAFSLLVCEEQELPSACGGRVHFFCWPKRNEPKKRAFLDKANLPTVSSTGFFDTASMPWRKTARIPARRPPGLQMTRRLHEDQDQRQHCGSCCLANSLSLLQTRRAAGMDARRFPTEPWMASRKIPGDIPIAGLPCRGKRFSLVRFFWRFPKEMNPAAAGGRNAFTSNFVKNENPTQ